MRAPSAVWVDAGPFRAHLRHVMAVGGLSSTEVAALAGVSPRLAGSLLTGRAGRPVRRISPDSARALLAVDAMAVRHLSRRQVPAEESRRRLRRLLRQQPDLRGLAERLGATVAELERLGEPGSRWCSALLALRLLTTVRAAPPVRTAPAACAEVGEAAAA